MKKQLQLGLVVEGNSTGSAMLRMPSLARELGPIKSGALRAAHRLSNFLRAGYPIGNYKELSSARLILLRVPDSAAPRIIGELCASDLVFRDVSFVLCESWLTLDVLEPLKMRGASVATLVRVSSARRDLFALEGQPAAVRRIHRFIESNDAQAVEIRPGAKQLLFAAELLATVLPVPLLVAAKQALRAAGISGSRLHTVLNEMAGGMLSGFLKGGQRTWGGPLNQCSAEIADGYFEALRLSHPEIAGVVDALMEWARREMSKPGNAKGASKKLQYHQAAST
ncbi:MAG: hypothetical protein WB992_24955 [Bryobacteraceae bacterium]